MAVFLIVGSFKRFRSFISWWYLFRKLTAKILSNTKYAVSQIRVFPVAT